MSVARRRAALPALLGIFAALAGLYSVATPVFEGPDEVWHFAFASHLADGGRLPVLSAQRPNLLLRNAAHPPLYYLPVAVVIAPIDRQDFPGQFRFNLASPHITPGSFSDRPNLFIHPAREDWPYRQTVLAVHLGRLVSIALGVLTLAGVFAGARRLLPADDGRLALLAVALAAGLPQFVYGSAVINNDALAAAAGAWLLVALVALIDTLSLRWAIAAGLLLAVGLLSKIGMIALLPLPAAALLFSAVPRLCPAPALVGRRPALGRLFLLGAAVYALAALVAGWWYLRNWRLYGDPLAWREWQALAGVGRSSLTPAQYLADMLGLFGTFWVDFGLRADRAWVWAFVLLALLAVAGLIRRWRQRRWPVLHPAGLLLAGLWFGLLLASALRYALVISDIHGRLLYPALTLPALALALGLTGWGPRWGPRLAYGTAVALLLLTALVPWLVIRPAFARPTVATGALPSGATPLTVPFDGLVALAGFQANTAVVEPGGTIPVTSYWRLAGGPVPHDVYAVFALVRPDGQVVGRQEALLGSSVYPSSTWLPTDLVELQTAIPVDAAYDGPVSAAIWLGVRGPGAGLLPSPAGDTVSLGRVAITRAEACSIDRGAAVTFGGQISLAGYQVDPDGVTLCWQALQPLAHDYTVFVHVLDASGALLATGDGPPRAGHFPTTFWPPGQFVQDRHPVPVPPDARVSVGLYRQDDGTRLPIDGRAETAFTLTP